MLLCRDLRPGEARHWHFATPGVPEFDEDPWDGGEDEALPDPEERFGGLDVASRRRAQTSTYRDYLESLIDMKGAFGVFSGSECLGMIAAQPFGPGRAWELWECMVRPSCRRRGLGTRLLNKMAGDFKGRGVESLLCLASPWQAEARAFLKARGFQMVGVDSDRDLLILQRRL
jgi:ribosomal protein S18 acetylase RimI-like enzyme